MPNLLGALLCQTEAGKPAALVAKCFIQPVYHEASPVMIQTGPCTGDNDSSSTSSSNSNNNDNNNHSNNNSTTIKLSSGLWPKKYGVDLAPGLMPIDSLCVKNCVYKVFDEE